MEGVSTVKVPKFEVLSITDLYGARPDLVEMYERPIAINKAIREGATEIPGLRIWWETQVSTR